MTTTLNHDELEPEREITHNYAPHNIVYGKSGWTDDLDDGTVALLEEVGVVHLYKTVSGVGFETRIYVSVKGKEPR